MKKFTILVIAISLWIHTSVVFSDETWTTLRNGSRITDIELQDDYVWAKTQGGLIRWDMIDGSYKWFTADDGLISDKLTAIFVSNNSDLWIGTRDGLQKYDGTSFTTYTSQDSDLLENSISGIAEAEDGTMWFSSYGGVLSFDGTKWTEYTAENSGLLVDYTRNITIDNAGIVWITYSAYWSDGKQENYGVVSFDGSTWMNYSTDNSGLGSNDIDAIVVDSNNVKWFKVIAEASMLLPVQGQNKYYFASVIFPFNILLP